MINRAAQHCLIVDVGANGRLRSNSFDLMRTFGWKGLLIEANPNRIPIIEAEFHGLDMQIVSCAVSDYTGTASLHLGMNDDISSLSPDATGSWGAIKGEVSVAVRPLAAILSEHDVPQDFDVLSVDAEGEDVRIINAALTDGYRPRWIIMEKRADKVEIDLKSLGLLEIVTQNYHPVDRAKANIILMRKDIMI